MAETEQLTEPEVVDGVIVREPAPIERRLASAPVPLQAAAVAGASLVAGATAVALARGVSRRRSRRGGLKLGGRRKGTRLDVVATRTFLVDVHLVDRR
jgi:hypothetical protein